MAKAELGTKRLCGNCGIKFYDLGKTPIVCPKCDTVIELTAASARARPEATPAARPPAPPAEEEAAVPETGDAELVSLEDADAESQGKSSKTDSAEDSEDDIEIDENLDDSTFIEEQEEGDEDVTDIIGDVNDEEES